MMAPASDSAQRQPASGADQRRGLRRKTTAVTDVFNLEPCPPPLRVRQGPSVCYFLPAKKRRHCGRLYLVNADSSSDRFILPKRTKLGRRQSSITLGKCFRVWCLTFVHCVAVLLLWPRPHCAPALQIVLLFLKPV